jgi:hypothetical protein
MGIIADIRKYKSEPSHEKRILTNSLPFILLGAAAIAYGSYIVRSLEIEFDVNEFIKLVATTVVGVGSMVFGVIRMKKAVDTANAINSDNNRSLV